VLDTVELGISENEGVAEHDDSHDKPRNNKSKHHFFLIPAMTSYFFDQIKIMRRPVVLVAFVDLDELL